MQSLSVLVQVLPFVIFQDGRDLQLNRKLARERLRLQIDEHLNGENSVLARQRKDEQA